MDWLDARGRRKYTTLNNHRKREVRKVTKLFKVGWDKEYEGLTQDRAEWLGGEGG